jgi:hypothetical protein
MNTLTSLTQTIYMALDTVSRELVGFVPAVFRNSSAERAALNQTITYPIAPAASAADNTPGVTPPDTGDETVGNGSISISKSKHVPIRWNGEEQRAGVNSGWYAQLLQDQFAQAMRTLVNLIEVDLASTYKNASRAYGTAGTAPFGTAGDFSDAAQVRKILDDNGCPQSDLHLVLNTSAIANLRGKQSTLFKVNEAGSSDLLRRGLIGDIEGFAVHSSAGISVVTKGTGASYQVNHAAYAAGDTSITVDTGSGTVLAGDVVTWTGDTNKYVVGTALAANVLVLNKPGLRAALADDTAMTVGNSFSPNMAFHKNAIHLVTRAPVRPTMGDLASDVMIVQDPVSGLAFEVAHYPGFRQGVFHVSIAWGWAAIKSEHIGILLG